MVSRIAPMYEEDLDSYEDLPTELATARPPQYAGGHLGAYNAMVSALAVLRGPAFVTPLLERVVPQIVGAIQQIPSAIDSSSMLPALNILSFMNTARCCGVTLPGEATGIENAWIPQLATQTRNMTERERNTLALAAGAASQAQWVPAFVGGSSHADRFVPNEVHGFNVSGYCGYVALAVAQSRSYTDVEPAWLDFVHRFPIKLDTTMLGWPALVWAARAVYATIGKIPESEVVLELHRLVTDT
jgi:hypothetical protein